MRVIDSHTEGEPTRVIVEGGPNLGHGSLAERVQRFKTEFDHIRSMVVLEPRGNDAVVGALLCEPVDPSSAAAAIFFNNAGYLGMCGHGAIGVAVTLAYQGRIKGGRHRLETPVGIVEFELNDLNTVAIENVPSYRYRANVSVETPTLGVVRGDIAWGGNWFFLIDGAPSDLQLKQVANLTVAATEISQALADQGITGKNDEAIDHIEFFGPPIASSANSRNFVLCPGGAYDRSPCGTGTSAKLACLAADGKLAEGEPWVQESIIGSRFIASYRINKSDDDTDVTVTPTITGRAFVCAETTLIQQPDDPFANGIRSDL